MAAIIAVLMAMLLPAVQQAREAARRTKCTNNLKQLGIALHNYHDIHRQFPPGIMYAHPSGVADRLGKRGTGWGWNAMILPFIDQLALFGSIDFSLPPFDAGNQSAAQLSNQAVISTPLEIATCPSDTIPSPIPTRAARKVVEWAGASYAGNSGSFQLSADASDPMEANGLLGQARSGRNYSAPRTHRLRDITDGTSQTILLAESCWRLSETDEGLPTGKVGRKRWYGSMDIRFSHGGEWSRLLSTGRFRMNSQEEDGISAMRSAASSEHAGGAQFVLADGSVKFLNETIEHTGRSYSPGDPYDRAHGGAGYGLYQRLWSISDGLLTIDD